MTVERPLHHGDRNSPAWPPTALVVLALSLVLGGCGDGDGDDGSGPRTDERSALAVRLPAGAVSSELDSPWLADIDLFQIAPRPDTTGDVTVELVRHEDSVDFDAHVESYERDLDVCFIRDIDVDDGVEDGADGGQSGDGKRNVSGGDVLTLSSAGGTWLDVPFSIVNAAYEGDDVFPGPMPADLSLSLPGAVFPAVDALALPVPSVPERLSPLVGEPITPASEYRWVSGDGAPGTSVRLSFRSYVDGDFRGFPISCRVVDDGEFALPEEVLAEVSRRQGELNVRFTREVRRLEYRDGAALFQVVSIADD